MKILVTGGAGYIGSQVCKHLTAHGHDVIVYDNLSTGFRELARWGVFEYGDMLDEPRLRDCLAPPWRRTASSTLPLFLRWENPCAIREPITATT